MGIHHHIIPSLFSLLRLSSPSFIPSIFFNRCDICQQVCPFNKVFVDESPLWGSPDEEVTSPKLAEILELDEKGFKERFRASPILRIKRRRLLRNAAVALGNTKDVSAIPILEKVVKREGEDPMIVSHAQWAIDYIRKCNPSIGS